MDHTVSLPHTSKPNVEISNSQVLTRKWRLTVDDVSNLLIKDCQLTTMQARPLLKLQDTSMAVSEDAYSAALTAQLMASLLVIAKVWLFKTREPTFSVIASPTALLALISMVV